MKEFEIHSAHPPIFFFQPAVRNKGYAHNLIYFCRYFETEDRRGLLYVQHSMNADVHVTSKRLALVFFFIDGGAHEEVLFGFIFRTSTPFFQLNPFFDQYKLFITINQ